MGNVDARTTSLAHALRVSLWAALLVLSACSRAESDPSQGRDVEVLAYGEPVAPLPLEAEYEQGPAALGEELFFSTIVSSDGRVSCSSCHAMDHGLAQTTAFAEIPTRPRSLTNSTTLFNVRYFQRLTWSGRFTSLEAHLDALIVNPKLMTSSWDDITGRLRASAEWQRKFAVVFSNGVTQANTRHALAEYERSLVTPNAPFDRYLRGDRAAITAKATTGYALFKEYGCVSCHQGASLGANVLQRFGIMSERFADGGEHESDLGRYAVTHREDDRHVFRVPSLRNVALTAPYFHDGSAPTLKDAIDAMADHQLGLHLADDEIDAIAAFLAALTGEYRGKPL